MSLAKKLLVEFIGTFWLVFGGCGSAVLAAGFTTGAPDRIHLGIGFMGVALAFGLTLLTMVYTIGPISGCHINPAVSFGLWAGKRFSAMELIPYILAQVSGAIMASFILYLVASGKSGFDLVASGFAANGYGEHSPGGYSLFAALVAEVVLTYIFLLIILGSTDSRAPAGFAGLAIGLALTLIHLISIPVTNTSLIRPGVLVLLFLWEVGLCSNSGSSGWPPSSGPCWLVSPTAGCGGIKRVKYYQHILSMRFF